MKERTIDCDTELDPDLCYYSLNGIVFLSSVYVSYQLSKELHRDIFNED